jgi:hypothetical protein
MVIYVIGTNGHLANDYEFNSPLEDEWAKCFSTLVKKPLLHRASVPCQ